MAHLFIIDDEKELYALWVALLEAKFHPEPESPEVQGSPFVARLVERVSEALIEFEESKYNFGNAERYRAHLKKGEQILDILPCIKNQLLNIPNNVWLNWTIKQKEMFLKDLLSPFEISQDLFNELIMKKGNI